MKRAIGALLCAFGIVFLGGCGEKADAEAARENVEAAATLLCTAPNDAHRRLTQALGEAGGTAAGLGAAEPAAAALALYRDGLDELYGAYFTPDCLSRLDSERLLTMIDDLARAKDATVAVEEVRVGQPTEGWSVVFTAQVVCSAEAVPETRAEISGSAQCLPEDGGKISALRLEPSRELIAALN